MQSPILHWVEVFATTILQKTGHGLAFHDEDGQVFSQGHRFSTLKVRLAPMG